jgi:hypothetical protein
MRAHAWITVVAAAAAVVAAAGCGSSSTSSGSGEENKTADQIFNDALSALDSQPVVHVSQTSTDSTGKAKQDATITGDAGRASITDPSGSTTIIVFTGGQAYASVGGSAFQQLTGDLQTEVSSITIHHTVGCARTEHGTLTKGSISTVNGKRVIAIMDDGKAPGATPGTVDVALDGPPLPVHIEQTGPATAGGSLACGHSPQSSVTAQTIDFDYPGGNVTITAPPAASS